MHEILELSDAFDRVESQSDCCSGYVDGPCFRERPMLMSASPPTQRIVRQSLLSFG